VQAAGSIETLPEWRMWNDEVVAMGRKTQQLTKSGVESSYGLARRVELATAAVKALQMEMIKCPPVAREIITAREILHGIAHALALDDEQCLKQACEVIIMCAQECGARAADAVVGCSKLLNGLCRQAMTENPTVIDALTALSHQNEKMLWIVTTIIKVMRVEKKCETGLLGRVFVTWSYVRGTRVRGLELLAQEESMARTKDALLQVASGPISGDRTFFPQSQKMCDVDDYYLQTISARSYPSDQARGVIVDNSTKGMFVPGKAIHPKGVNRIRDDIIIEPSAPSAFSTMQSRSNVQPSSLYSSWNASSTPLYATWNANADMPWKEHSSVGNFAFLPEKRSDSHSTSSSLSMPSSTGSHSTFSSIKINKEVDHNPELMMSVTEKLLYRSHQLNSEVDGVRTTRTLSEPRVLPEREWISPEDEKRQEFETRTQLTVPPDSLLFASRSSNAAPSLYASWNGSSSVTVQRPAGRVEERAQLFPVQPASSAWKGSEFNVSAGSAGDPLNACSVYSSHSRLTRQVFDEQILRAQAMRPAPVQHARTPSAPPRLVRSEAPSTLTPETMWKTTSSIGAPVSRAVLPGSTVTPSGRTLSPPRTLPPIRYVEPATESSRSRTQVLGAASMQLPMQTAVMEGVTIQVPIHKAAPGSVCDVDVDQQGLFNYFSRGRSMTRGAPSASREPGSAQVHIEGVLAHTVVRSTSPMRATLASRTLGSVQTGSVQALSPRVDHRDFHKQADDFAFERIGVGAMMARGQSPQRAQSPPRSSPPGGRSVSPPPTRSIVGASTIQFANTTMYNGPAAPQTAPMLRQSSPLRHRVEMCDVDETLMQPAFVGFTGPQVSANDWVQAPASTSHCTIEYVPEKSKSPVDAGFNRVYVPAASPVSAVYMDMMAVRSGHMEDDEDDWC